MGCSNRVDPPMIRETVLIAAVSVACSDECPEPPQEIDGHSKGACEGGCCAYSFKSCDFTGQCQTCTFQACQTACGEWVVDEPASVECSEWKDDPDAPCDLSDPPETHNNATPDPSCWPVLRDACCLYSDAAGCTHTLCQVVCGVWEWPDTTITCP